MHVIDLLTVERIAVDAVARSKKRALELASEMLCREQPELKSRDVYASLCARERLGSTGFGRGVALPHGRLEGTRAVSGAFIRLRDPVDFEAMDRSDVDLIFALIVPVDCEERHLELLSQLASLFNDGARREKLRHAGDALDVMRLLEGWQTTVTS
ncbi:MAG: PTS sugar transporter subunit IIA [Pseudomonadota bacterium]